MSLGASRSFAPPSGVHARMGFDCEVTFAHIAALCCDRAHRRRVELARRARRSRVLQFSSIMG